MDRGFAEWAILEILEFSSYNAREPKGDQSIIYNHNYEKSHSEVGTPSKTQACV